jgi:hypothetical protein
MCMHCRVRTLRYNDRETKPEAGQQGAYVCRLNETNDGLWATLPNRLAQTDMTDKRSAQAGGKAQAGMQKSKREMPYRGVQRIEGGSVVECQQSDRMPSTSPSVCQDTHYTFSSTSLE